MSALAKKRSPPKGPPKGWRTLHADVCWEDHGGLWCKRDTHASSKRAYNLCRFERCEWDEDDSDDSPRYECSTGLAGYGSIDWDHEYKTGGSPRRFRASCIRGL